MSIQVVNRNNVVAGTFLIVSVLLAVAISFILSDIKDNFGSKKQYVFRFSTTVGVSGLKPGADITFGGFSVGKVKSIDAYTVADPQSGEEIIKAHDVIVTLRSDLVLYEDAYADLTLPMLGGISKINIPSAGTGPYEGGPSDPNATLDEGEALRGRFAPSILTQLGFTTEDAIKIQETIDSINEVSSNAKDVTDGFKRMSEALEPEFIDGVDDGRATIANIRSFTESFTGETGWSTKVDDILTDAQDASGKLAPAIDDAKETISNANGLIGDSRPRISRILDNVEQTTERIRFDSMGQIDDLLEKGSLALGSYKDVADSANELVNTNRPKIDATLDSARDIGVSSKLLVEELRAQPWRILKKPSKDDLAREPIYEAARMYAQSVSDLRIASEALDVAVAQSANSGNTVNAAELVRIAALVEQAYGRYEEAERGLLERLRGKDPQTSP
ncbi:MAG: hypothetical protein P1U42_06060 [Phycisphaerales bacterium]|nr:hypothetical protein [Phycisphaerales bacterium]